MATDTTPPPASLNEPFGDTEQLPDDAPFPEGWDEGRKYRCVRTGRQPPSEGELPPRMVEFWERMKAAEDALLDALAIGGPARERAADAACRYVVHHFGDMIRRLAASGQVETRDEARQDGYELGLLAASGQMGDEVRRNDDGSLDEVVGTGDYHLEQMDVGRWSLRLGRHLIGLHSKRAIKADIIENDLPATPTQQQEGR